MQKATIAARFMAFTWYLNLEPVKTGDATDAAAFAQDHWDEFLPLVSEELGEALTQPAPAAGPKPQEGERAQRKPGRRGKMALAG